MSRYLSTLLILFALSANVYCSYFIITQPTAGTKWESNASNPVTWVKGFKDGVNAFDVELARLSNDGLIFAARGVPSSLKSFYVDLLDVPPGDDYFLLFINSTHGGMYATSNRFTILAPSTPANTAQPGADTTAPTITLSGGPHPTKAFATTFPADPNAASNSAGSIGRRGWRHDSWAGVGVLVLGCMLGAGWTLW